jgi:hypothetical protein
LKLCSPAGAPAATYKWPLIKKVCFLLNIRGERREGLKNVCMCVCVVLFFFEIRIAAFVCSVYAVFVSNLSALGVRKHLKARIISIELAAVVSMFRMK